MYDNASVTNNLDNSVFSSLIVDAMSNDAPDTVSKAATGGSTNFTLTTGSFAGKRNIEIRIMPNSERGLYGILNSNFAVFGEPQMMGVSSTNDNVNFDCKDTLNSQNKKNTTCSIDDNIPIGNYIKEYVKVNQYGTDETPRWVGGEGIPNITIIKTQNSDGLSALGIYNVYEILGQIEDATTYTGTIYFNDNPYATVNLKLNGYNDAPSTNLDSQISSLMVYKENIGTKRINVNDINVGLQNVITTNNIGLNTSTHSVDANSHTNTTLTTGVVKKSGNITIKIQKPMANDEASYYEEIYNVGTIDLNSLTTVSNKSSLKLSVPKYEGIKHSWKYKGKTISTSRVFKPKLYQRGKKASISVTYGSRTATRVFTIGKYKPTIKTSSKIVKNKIVSKITVKGYKLTGKLIKIGKRRYKLKKGIVRVVVPIKSKVKIVFIGNSKTKKTTKTIKVF